MNQQEPSIGRRTSRWRLSGEDGFTFIELLVGMIVLGILVAVTVPTYRAHNQAAADKLAQTDLRTAITVLETCAIDKAYPTEVTSAGVITGCDVPPLKLAENVSIRYETTGTPVKSFVLTSVNTSGGGQVYCYNSEDGGGSVQEVSGSLSSATC